MQFQVPQFIDIEDKVIGPLTVRQFLYLAGAGALALTLLLIFAPILAVILMSPVVAIAIALAFYRVNGREFLVFLNALSRHFLRPRIFTWQKIRVAAERKGRGGEKKEEAPPPRPKPLPIEKKLKRLSWQLDIMKHENHE